MRSGSRSRLPRLGDGVLHPHVADLPWCSRPRSKPVVLLLLLLLSPVWGGLPFCTAGDAHITAGTLVCGVYVRPIKCTNVAHHYP
jgi:hypothetical protein